MYHAKLLKKKLQAAAGWLVSQVHRDDVLADLVWRKLLHQKRKSYMLDKRSRFWSIEIFFICNYLVLHNRKYRDQFQLKEMLATAVSESQPYCHTF